MLLLGLKGLRNCCLKSLPSECNRNVERKETGGQATVSLYLGEHAALPTGLDGVLPWHLLQLLLLVQELVVLIHGELERDAPGRFHSHHTGTLRTVGGSTIERQGMEGHHCILVKKGDTVEKVHFLECPLTPEVR